MDKKEYTYLDSSNVEHVVSISKEDFKLNQKDKSIHDTKFKTKPTTFFKDALKRFTKNKSSVAGAIILGTLLLLSVLIPVIDPSDIDTTHPSEAFLAPKLFDSGAGFWDGTEKKYDVPCDQNNSYEDPETHEIYYYPFETAYVSRAVKNLSLPRAGFVDIPSESVKGGFVNLLNDNTNLAEGATVHSATLESPSYNFDITKSYSLEIVFLAESVELYPQSENYALWMECTLENNETYQSSIIKFNDDLSRFYTESTTENPIDENSPIKVNVLNVPDIFSSLKADTSISNKNIKDAKLKLEINGFKNETRSLFIKSVAFNSSDDTSLSLKKLSFSDANQMCLATSSSASYWTFLNGTKKLYNGLGYVCDFTYDTYEAVYGLQLKQVGETTIKEYIEKGWIDSSFSAAECYKSYKKNPNAYFESKKIAGVTDKYCPIDSIEQITMTESGGEKTYSFKCRVYGYKILGYTSMPRFLAGTTNQGLDLLKSAFVGLRNSLGLGLLTFVICFSVGLVWGAISGYFGGTIDIVMQRFTDILSGVPWIVVMTICILNLGSNFGTFILAMCLTGWIGTAGLTRTQFYRFRDREYTLASRTLGASNFRLIFKHILPNAMGTIITSSVLMIPSVIFSEATISYLGLGFQDMHSLGVILSKNQAYLSTFPHLILFPSAIMALIMISLNLFGNGVRDAFNPSLKGSE